MTKIIADVFASTSSESWPTSPPVFSKEGLRLKCEIGMPRADLINGIWVFRNIMEGPEYANACYEVVVLLIGDTPAAYIMVRRVIHGIREVGP